MQCVNMLQAKYSLSRLPETIESGKEREIVIARNSTPAAKPVPMSASVTGMRLELAKGQFVIPGSRPPTLLSRAAVRGVPGNVQSLL